MATAAERPGRADARRNREIVLRTAMRVFTEEGPDASLVRIAERAGVGAGTVYRHFPSKESLLEAVLVEHFTDLVAAAGRWTARATPGEALFGFLLDVIDASDGRRYVCDALPADRGWPRARLAEATRRFRAVLDDLLRAARRAGAVRPDVRTDDLVALMVGGAALRSAHPSRARGVRLTRALFDGVRAPDVTEGARFRDGSVRRGHGTAAAGFCGECGTPLAARPTGRPPRYCGPTCRQRAHRRRLAG